ncbi:hypothetical protein Hanom_Chr09g00786231 [Helianthus anomalus]
MTLLSHCRKRRKMTGNLRYIQKKTFKKVEPPRTKHRDFFEYSNEAILLRC